MREREAVMRALGLGAPDIGAMYPDSMILGPPTEMAGTLFSGVPISHSRTWVLIKCVGI